MRIKSEGGVLNPAEKWRAPTQQARHHVRYDSDEEVWQGHQNRSTCVEVPGDLGTQSICDISWEAPSNSHSKGEVPVSWDTDGWVWCDLSEFEQGPPQNTCLLDMMCPTQRWSSWQSGACWDQWLARTNAICDVRQRRNGHNNPVQEERQGRQIHCRLRQPLLYPLAHSLQLRRVQAPNKTSQTCLFYAAHAATCESRVQQDVSKRSCK